MMMISLAPIRLFYYIASLACLFCLSACSTSRILPAQLALSAPQPINHFEQEVMVERISQVLALGNLKQKERANLYFERGVLYDSLGLWALARLDFIQAFSLQPKMAALYNYLGLYLLLDGNYDGAIEAFDNVFDLDADYEYTHLNRGLALYYTERYQQAAVDFQQFYRANPQDPYRVLWLYLNELKIDPPRAQQNLAARATTLSPDFWGSYLVQFYLQQLSVEQLFAKAKTFADPNSPQYAEILTETYFYLAKQQLNISQIDEAETLFKLAMANQVYNFVEYRFALFELARLKNSHQSTARAVVQRVVSSQ